MCGFLGVDDEQHFIRISLQTETANKYQFPELGHLAGLNASSRFDHYREFKTALNAEMYLDCIKQKCFRDCLVRISDWVLVISVKVHKNRYARSDVLLNDCPFCPGMQGNELHLFFVCKKYKKKKKKTC